MSIDYKRELDKVHKKTGKFTPKQLESRLTVDQFADFAKGAFMFSETSGNQFTTRKERTDFYEQALHNYCDSRFRGPPSVRDTIYALFLHLNHLKKSVTHPRFIAGKLKNFNKLVDYKIFNQVSGEILLGLDDLVDLTIVLDIFNKEYDIDFEPGVLKLFFGEVQPVQPMVRDDSYNIHLLEKYMKEAWFEPTLMKYRDTFKKLKIINR